MIIITMGTQYGTGRKAHNLEVGGSNPSPSPRNQFNITLFNDKKI